MRRPKLYNPDGSKKTIDQLMRQTMTVLQYGRAIATMQKAVTK